MPGQRIAAPERQRGLTLIELMISVTIGLVVVGAVTYMYVGSRGAYRGNESQARIQEGGRFAIDAISADLRRAGGLGCGTFASVGSVAGVYVNLIPPATQNAPGGTIDPTTLAGDTSGPPQLIPIQGLSPTYPQSSTGAKPAAFLLPATAATPPYWRGDVLQLQIATGSPLQVIADPDLAGKTITVENNTLPDGTGRPNFSPADYVVVANCSAATVFQASSVAAAAPTSTFPAPALLGFTASSLTQPAQVGYGIGSYSTVQHFDQVTYYVGKAPGAASPALYRYSLRTGTAEEVADNVEDLDVEYAVQGAGAFETATTATGNGDWPNVVSVRVSVIAVGDQQGTAPTAQTLQFHGAGTAAGAIAWNAPGDGRLRQIFTATATLRDRIQ